MQKLKLMVAGFTVVGAGLFMMTPAMAVSCPSGSAREDENVNSLAECNVTKDDSLWPTINGIINVVLGVLAVVAVVMIIMGGVSYITSAGDAAKVKKGRDTILYGVIGLVIALLSFAIVNFILNDALNGSTAANYSTLMASVSEQ